MRTETYMSYTPVTRGKTGAFRKCNVATPPFAPNCVAEKRHVVLPAADAWPLGL